jgi:hypothetical protein
MSMLPDAFLDWWFAPWTYAGAAATSLRPAGSALGRRDAYRWWCAASGVAPALPTDFDAGWQIAAVQDGRLLATTAKLFGGLLAARRQEREALAQLALDDRKWCMSVASLQPLAEYAQLDYAPDDTLEVRGLTELSCRLEHAFPGMWSRLRLLLPPDTRDRLQALLEQEAQADEPYEAAPQRALRCWQMCSRRAADHG